MLSQTEAIQCSGGVSLGGNTVWQQDWSSLLNLSPTSATTTVSVPMFYRVSCLTNGFFWPMPLGGMGTYSVSNAVSGIWTQQFQCLGILSVPSSSNQYLFAPNRDPSGTNAGFYRSTDRAMYITPNGYNEQLKWTNGPVGATWTYQDAQGPEVSTILRSYHHRFCTGRHLQQLPGSLQPLWFLFRSDALLDRICETGRRLGLLVGLLGR